MQMDLEVLAVDSEDGGLLSFKGHIMCLGELIFGETGDEVGFAHLFGALNEEEGIQKKHRSKF